MNNARRGGLPSVSNLIRHHWVILLLAVLGTTGLAAFYVSSQPATYTATSRILLSPAPGNPLTPQAASSSAIQLTIAMETESQLVNTAGVRDTVSTQLGWVVPALHERLRVEVPANTQMLEIHFTSDTPAGAVAGAQGFAEGYLDYRSERARASQDSSIKALNDQLETLRDSLKKAITKAAADGAGSFAASEVQMYTDRIAQLSNSLSAAEAVSIYPGTVIVAAEVPSSSNELPWWIVYAAGVLLGLMAGLGLAFFIEWRRDLIRDRDALSELGIPMLTMTPVRRAEDGSTLESDRTLRTAVVANAVAPHVLGITSLGNADAARLAHSLAGLLAAAKFTVLLIDADPGGTSLAEITVTPEGEQGLTDALSGMADPMDSLIRRDGFDFLPAGSRVEELESLTASPQFRSLVARVRHSYDYVLLVTAATGLPEGEAALLAADSALLTAISDETTVSGVRATLSRFNGLGIRPLGLAMQENPTDTQQRHVFHPRTGNLNQDMATEKDATPTSASA